MADLRSLSDATFLFISRIESLLPDPHGSGLSGSSLGRDHTTVASALELPLDKEVHDLRELRLEHVCNVDGKVALVFEMTPRFFEGVEEETYDPIVELWEGLDGLTIDLTVDLKIKIRRACKNEIERLSFLNLSFLEWTVGHLEALGQIDFSTLSVEDLWDERTECLDHLIVAPFEIKIGIKGMISLNTCGHGGDQSISPAGRKVEEALGLRCLDETDCKGRLE
jgi:hypothetical protein